MGTFTEQNQLPTYWYNKASDLHRAAKVVYDADCNTAVFRMLGGMSIEALLKALIVEKGAQPRLTHLLNVLARDADVAYSNDSQKLLQILSEAIIWDGRYPVPTDEKHWIALNELEMECLFDKKPFSNTSKLFLNIPNDNLNWEAFNSLWAVSFDQLRCVASWLG